jgi:PAS domain S-box-containing protein
MPILSVYRWQSEKSNTMKVTKASKKPRVPASIPKGDYQSAFQHADVALSLLDLELTILDVNDRFCQLLARSKEEIIGAQMDTLFAPETDDFIAQLRHAVGQSAPAHFEASAVLKAGRKVQLSAVVRRIDAANERRVLVSLREGSEPRQAKEPLRESERRFRAMADTAPVMIWQSGADKLCHYFNKQWLDFTGRTLEQELGNGWTEGVHPNDLKRCLDTYNAAFNARQDFQMEYRLRRYDGKYRWILDKGVPIFSGGEVFMGYIGSCIDITDRQRAESSLRESQKQLASIIGSAMDAIITVDSAQHIIFFNAAAEKMFRCRAEAVIGRPLDDFIPKRFRTAHKEHVKRFGETNMTSRSMGGLSAISGLRADGEEFPIEASISQVEINSKKLFTVIIRDITERKRAEEQLREQAALLDHATDAILVKGLDDRILYWNQGAERIYGWSAEETVGRHITELYNKEMDQNYHEAKRLLLEKGEWAGEFQRTTKSGKSITIESHWTLMRDPEGRAKSVLVINTDATEKKRLATQFLRAQRMESIGTLAGGIAHDLNNILSPILTALGLFELRFTDPSSSRMISVLKESAERGSSLIGQVLSFARGIEGERVTLQPKHLIKEVIKILKDTLPKNIDLQYSLPGGLWTVSGDATQIHQVLMNLLINARDAMPHGGKITIVTSNVQLDENYARMNLDAAPGRYACICVGDTGSGIAKETLEKIFDPFFTTKEVGKGTGLGLSTVLTIVKSHGGFINVYSEVGKGTEFKVYLPSAEALLSEQTGEADLELPAGHGELILIADDEAAIREITKNTLEAYGYQVLTASDGTEAVALFAQHQDEVQLLLTDVMMPYLDGPLTIRAIRKMNPGIKVIISSGLKVNEKELDAESVGAQIFLSKPYTADKLLRAIAGLLSAK